MPFYNPPSSNIFPRLSPAFPHNAITNYKQQNNAKHNQQYRRPLILTTTAKRVTNIAALHIICGVVFDDGGAVGA